jgi:hypothetical protein
MTGSTGSNPRAWLYHKQNDMREAHARSLEALWTRSCCCLICCSLGLGSMSRGTAVKEYTHCKAALLLFQGAISSHRSSPLQSTTGGSQTSRTMLLIVEVLSVLMCLSEVVCMPLRALREAPKEVPRVGMLLELTFSDSNCCAMEKIEHSFFENLHYEVRSNIRIASNPIHSPESAVRLCATQFDFDVLSYPLFSNKLVPSAESSIGILCSSVKLCGDISSLVPKRLRAIH